MARRARHVAAAAVSIAMLATAACGSSAAPAWHASAPSGSPSTPRSTTTPSPSATAMDADACVATTLDGMSLAEIVGQVLLVGTPISDPASVGKVVRTYHIGGVFLAGRSHQTAAKLRSEIAALQDLAPASTGLLISLDQEGGEVQTLQGADFPPIPTATAQGKLDQATLEKQTAAWARRLAAIGINLDLAPVADTVPASLGAGNPPIGGFHRQYGSNPADVAEDIATVVPAIQSTGVITTLKHFPGLGRVKANTDYSTKAVDTVATADDPYLQPFVAGMEAGSGAVMISSASYPNIDPDHIGVFSAPIVTDLLRHQLGFTGMIVSDSLAGAAAVSIVPASQRALLFIKAGGDLALTTQASKAPGMASALLAEAKASPAFKTRVSDAARHVLLAKYAVGLLGCSPGRS